jgi:hypothetical protein
MEIQYMDRKIKYILAAVVVVVVLLVAAVAYQQKALMNLKKEISDGIQNDLGSQKNAAINSPSTVKAVQSTIVDNTKKINGSITAKNDKSLDIEAEIVDLSKLSAVPEESLLGDENSFPKIKKSYKVTVNDGTQYPSMAYKDLFVGMKVSVTSNELIYQSDSLTASEIITPSVAKAPLGDFLNAEKKINGQVKEINDKYLIVEVHWIDYSKVIDPNSIDFNAAPTIIKEYKVLISGNSVFPNNKNDLKVGDNIVVFSNKPTFSVAEFTAIKIERLIGSPSE